MQTGHSVYYALLILGQMLNLCAKGEVARVKRELLLAADQNLLKPHEQLWLWVTADAFVLVSRLITEAEELQPVIHSRTRAERIALENMAKRRLKAIQEENEWFGEDEISCHRIVCRGLGISNEVIDRLQDEIQRDLRRAEKAWREVLRLLLVMRTSRRVDGNRCRTKTGQRAVGARPALRTS